MYVTVPSLTYFSSRVILDINMIAREFPQHIYDSCRVFSTHSCDPDIHIYIWIKILQVSHVRPMSTEQCYLQRFDEVVTCHFICRAVFDADLLLFDAFSDEKIPHVNVTNFISTQILPIPLHENGALVILVYDIILHLETLAP